jgi:hypothetical protein
MITDRPDEDVVPRGASGASPEILPEIQGCEPCRDGYRSGAGPTDRQSKIASGRYADTIQLGASTTSAIFRSTATLQRM